MRTKTNSLFALAALGTYYAWRNRRRINQFFSQQKYEVNPRDQRPTSSQQSAAADVGTDDNYIRNASGI